MSEQTKTCAGCNETKDVSCFSKMKTAPDGLQSRCKICQNAASKANREANKDKRAAYEKAYREANRDKRLAYDKIHSQSQRGRYTIYKSNAKKRSLPFDLSFEDFLVFWQADCYYCGDQIATVGIDRADSSVGYTLANCVPCCTRCNVVKMDYSIEETNMHLLKMLKYQGIIG